MRTLVPRSLSVNAMPSSAGQPRFAKLAELAFETFCGEVGAVCNRVSDDQTGWDHVVEFHRSDDPEIPPDLRPASRRAFVQIKHSIREPRACELKLSNALRYAQDDQPWFVVFFVFARGGTQPTAIYVRHIWTAAMAEALRGSRAAHVAGRKLNTIKLRVRFEDAEVCADNPLHRILEALDQVGPGYGQQKTEIAQGLGYDSGVTATGSFTLGEGVTLEAFVDLQLGLIPSLPIQRFDLTDQRFGIPIQRDRLGPGEISITPHPARDCVVTFCKSRGTEEISWPGHIFVPVLPGLPLEARRMRVVAGPIQVVISGDGTATFTWSMPVESPQPVAELARQLAFRSWSDSEPLEIGIWSDGQCLSIGEVDVNPRPSDEQYWTQLRAAFGALMSVVPPERLPADFTVSLGVLIAEAESLQTFATYLSEAPAEVAMVMEAAPPESLEGTTLLVMPLFYELAGHVFIAVIQRTVTEVAVEGRKIVLQTRSTRILRGSVLAGSAEDHRAFVAREVQWAEKRAERGDGHVLSYRPQIDVKRPPRRKTSPV